MRTSDSFIGVVFFIVISVVCISGIRYLSDSQIRSEEDVVVESKLAQQLISKNGTTYRYLIKTDKGTFRSEENMFAGKFESTDTYMKLKEGHKYHLKLVGYGKGIITDYKNILELKEIK